MRAQGPIELPVARVFGVRFGVALGDPSFLLVGQWDFPGIRAQGHQPANDHAEDQDQQ